MMPLFWCMIFNSGCFNRLRALGSVSCALYKIIWIFVSGIWRACAISVACCPLYCDE
jgi:hypothetical protein